MTDDLIEFAIDTKDWGRILIARPLPRKVEDELDSWGCLAPLRDTPWGDLIPIVEGEIMSHALHGHATPLMRVIGPPPKALLKKVPEPFRQCSMSKNCLLFTKDSCQPGPKLPDCYAPPNVPEQVGFLITKVALAWKENRYVVVVRGAEFSF